MNSLWLFQKTEQIGAVDFVRHGVAHDKSSTESGLPWVSYGRAKDINVDGNDQPNLPSSDPAAGVGCDLNYLHGEENVTRSQV